jgi:hypothetical protein
MCGVLDLSELRDGDSLFLCQQDSTDSAGNQPEFCRQQLTEQITQHSLPATIKKNLTAEALKRD